MVLSECHCGSHTSKLLVFNQLLAVLTFSSAKRQLTRNKKSFSNVEYLEVTSNMVDPSATSSKSKGKQLALSSEESDIECLPGLKEILIEPEGIDRRTRIQIGAITPIDYNLLAREIEANDKHSVIVESHSSNSYEETHAFTYMTGTLEEVARRVESKLECNRRSTICTKPNKSLSMISRR